jgi:hypothetical protein
LAGPVDSSFPAWWFDLPLEKVESTECEKVFLAGEHEPGCDFHTLNVPVSYILENLNGLCVTAGKAGKIVRLHLSARPEDWLVDLRGKGHIPFAQFEC